MTPDALRQQRPHAALGHRIQQLRQQKARRVGDYTQAQLAADVGVHERTVTAWERGRQRPSDARLQRVARALDCSVEDLTDPAGPTITREFVAAYLDTIPEPHRRERQLDALDGFRRALAARGELPGWWWELKSLL